MRSARNSHGAKRADYDAIVIGSGPNGLAAAVTLARAGKKTLVVERAQTPGGGTRSSELTLPGFIHDLCSAVHPLAAASPAFLSFPLAQHGLEWIDPPLALAHPFDDGTAAAIGRSSSADGADGGSEMLGADAARYDALLAPLASRAEELFSSILAPPSLPAHPLLLSRFAKDALRSASGLARARFRGERARALFGGMAAHSFLPLTAPGSAAIGLVLAIAARARGWPIPRGGAQRIADALTSYLVSLGGEIRVGAGVDRVDDLPSSRALFFDLTQRELLRVAGSGLALSYREKLQGFRYGPGVFKMDFALSGPIPWKAPQCARAGTVHLGGELAELEDSESAIWEGRLSDRPFVLLSQPTLFDPGRAPSGKHVAWAYCHVPNGSDADRSDAIESQIERFAPGFKARILAKKTTTPRELELRNPNFVGGDISGGVMDLGRILLRQLPSRSPYLLPTHSRGIPWYGCSAAWPPGAGVHGMCGSNAAVSALKQGL